MISWLTRHPVVRILAAVVVGVWGFGAAALSVFIGHCAAFGGTCPDPEPLWSNDVVGGAFAGVAAGVFAIALAGTPSRRRLRRGLLLGLVLGVLAGLWAGAVTQTL